MLLPIFSPAYFLQFSLFYEINNALLCVTYACIGCIIIYNVKKGRRIQLPGWIVLVFFIVVNIATIRQGYNHSAINYSLLGLMPCMLYASSSGRDRKDIIQALLIIHIVLILSNLISIILFPSGMSYNSITMYRNYYFLGHKNTQVKIMFPGIVYSVFYDEIKYKRVRFRSYVLTAIVLISSIICDSVTAIIGISILSIYFVLYPLKKISNKVSSFITAKTILVGYVVVFIVLVILGNGAFLGPIVGWLGRNSTFTGRTMIWNQVARMILRKPILGYGYITSLEGYVSLWNYVPSGAHNLVLDVLLRGGLVLLGVLIVLLILCAKTIDNYSINYTLFPTWVLMTYAVMWEFEVYVNSGYVDMFLVLLIMSIGIPLAKEEIIINE